MAGEAPSSASLDSDPSFVTVAELCAAYLRWAQDYYVKDGQPTSELANVKRAIRALREIYASLPAKDFSPLKLREVRDHLVADDLARPSVNRYIAQIIRIFSWAIEREMIPPSIVHGLKAVKALQRGRSQARETEPVGPVSDADVEATLPHLSEPYAAMVRLQLITGMRPGEACSMTLGNIDRSGAIWIYRPSSHKTQHKNKARIIPIGPKAQLVLQPWIPGFPDMLLFRSRKGSRIRVKAYYNAVAKACKKAGIEGWSPNQLRHSAGTKIREQASLDAAQVILGHSSVATTQVYAERNLKAALKIAAEVG
jgi:integrase